MMDLRVDRRGGYKYYHTLMNLIGDCDPAYPALRYVADRFELNEEQRYWLAWLYSLSYCAPTAFYMLNEFPDYENVDTRRLSGWWSKNKKRCLFQTDRAKVKNFDKIVPMFESYRDMVGGSQEAAYKEPSSPDPHEYYDRLFRHFGKLYYFGRFSLFLLLEAVHEMTRLPIQPSGLDLRDALSCRNGLCYAVGKNEWVQKKNAPRLLDLDKLTSDLASILTELRQEYPQIKHTYWNVETSLCSYKKLFWETRYLGYYIDRQLAELHWMNKAVREGVDWSVLWSFRREHFAPFLLGEVGGWRGPRPERLKIVTRTGLPWELNLPLRRYTNEIRFRGEGHFYDPDWRSS